MDGDDVGMTERRGGAGFLHEAPAAFRVGHGFGRQELDGYRAIQTSVQGTVDNTHPAFAKFFDNLFDNLVVRNRRTDHVWGGLADRMLAQDSF